MADISSLYPQPVNPAAAQPSLLQNPLQALTFANGAQQLQSRNAVGSALQGAIDPSGNFDSNAALAAIKNNPAAAYGAPEAIGSVLQMRGQNISNATNRFGLLAGQNQSVLNLLGPLAQNPNATKDDALNVAPSLARLGVPPEMISGWIGGLSDDPKTFRKQIGTVNSIALGPAGAASRIQGAPGPSGEPTQTSAGAQGFGSPTTSTGMAPGAAEALAANRAEYVNDQSTSAARMANVRQLQTALPLISQLSSSNFGPGSPEFAKIKGALTTMGVVDPSTSDLRVRQEAGKYLLKYASGAIQAGRSDNALSAAIGSNPNLDLTQPANLSLIKNQIGMDRMDAALPLVAPSDTSQYKNFKSKFYQSADPRAFSFDMMTPAERAQVQTSLGAPSTAAKPNPAYDKFVRSYQMAKQAGMLSPPAPGGP